MKLHKNNGGDGTWRLRDENILAAFHSSDEWGEYLAGIPLEEALRKFIVSAKGLSSSFDEAEFEELVAMAKAVRYETTDYTDLHRRGDK